MTEVMRVYKYYWICDKHIHQMALANDVTQVLGVGMCGLCGKQTSYVIFDPDKIQLVKESVAVKPGDIVQVVREDHRWYMQLVVVTEFREWGIVGYVTIYNKGDIVPMYTRIIKDAYVKVGEVSVMLEKSDG